MVALYDWHVPPAPPVGVAWPVPAEPRVVPYTTADGRIVGNGATRFGAVRQDALRRHAGIDLVCAPGDAVVAIGPGRVLGHLGGYVHLDALAIDHGPAVAVYAEIAFEARVRAGDAIAAGQRIGTGARTPDGGSMLHFELWAPDRAPAAYTPWWVDHPPPAGLFDPTAALLALAGGAAVRPRSGPTVGQVVGALVAGALGLAITERIR